MYLSQTIYLWKLETRTVGTCDIKQFQTEHKELNSRHGQMYRKNNWKIKTKHK